MSQSISHERFLSELMPMFEEAFETHHGIFLDRGTTLFDTLEQVSAEDASLPLGPDGATVAAHVAHLDFYLEVVEGVMLHRPSGKIDWRAIWSTVRSVTPEEWEALQQKLRASYQRVTATVRAVTDWNEEDAIGSAITMVIHTAAHLGAIRQGLRAIGRPVPPAILTA